MRLRTSHGTYVVKGMGSELLHLGAVPEKALEASWLGALLPLLEPGLVDAEVTEGPLSPSTLVLLGEGRVAFRREQRYLCADPRFPELRFDRDEVGPWESFAIITMSETVVRQSSADDADESASWVELQLNPVPSMASAASSLAECREETSATFHITDVQEYRYAPITTKYEHLRLFQKLIRNYHPAEFGKSDIASCFMNVQKSKYLITGGGSCGILLDQNNFIKSGLF